MQIEISSDRHSFTVLLSKRARQKSKRAGPLKAVVAVGELKKKKMGEKGTGH